MLLPSKTTVNLSEIILNDSVKLNAMLMNKIFLVEPDEIKAIELYGSIMHEALLVYGYKEFNRMQLFKEINGIAKEIISQYKKGEKYDMVEEFSRGN